MMGKTKLSGMALFRFSHIVALCLIWNIDTIGGCESDEECHCRDDCFCENKRCKIKLDFLNSCNRDASCKTSFCQDGKCVMCRTDDHCTGRHPSTCVMGFCGPNCVLGFCVRNTTTPTPTTTTIPSKTKATVTPTSALCTAPRRLTPCRNRNNCDKYRNIGHHICRKDGDKRKHCGPMHIRQFVKERGVVPTGRVYHLCYDIYGTPSEKITIYESLGLTISVTLAPAKGVAVTNTLALVEITTTNAYIAAMPGMITTSTKRLKTKAKVNKYVYKMIRIPCDDLSFEFMGGSIYVRVTNKSVEMELIVNKIPVFLSGMTGDVYNNVQMWDTHHGEINFKGSKIRSRTIGTFYLKCFDYEGIMYHRDGELKLIPT